MYSKSTHYREGHIRWYADPSGSERFSVTFGSDISFSIGGTSGPWLALVATGAWAGGGTPPCTSLPLPAESREVANPTTSPEGSTGGTGLNNGRLRPRPSTELANPAAFHQIVDRQQHDRAEKGDEDGHRIERAAGEMGMPRK